MAKLTGVKTIDMVNGEITKISYEGAEYAKVDGEVMFGDVLLRVSGGLSGQVTVGEYYEGHASYEGDQAVRYRDEDGDVMCTARSRFVAFRKINANQSNNDTLTAKVDELDSRVSALEKGDKPAYKTEKRAAEVGERILITNAQPSRRQDYSEGDIFKVTTVHACCAKDVKVAGQESFIDYAEYEVIVEETPAKPAPAKELTHVGETYMLVSRKAQAGDVVIPTGDTTSDYVHKDTPYLVNAQNFIEGFPVYRDVQNRTEANVLVYEKKAPALKVGDYVRVKDGADSRHGDIGAGTIVKVTDFGQYSSRKVRVNLLDDSDYDYFNADDLELVDEKIVTFAKIGRKPNEFKKGDIVRLLVGSGADDKGTVVEIREDGGWTYQRLDRTRDWFGGQASWFQLVTPVESRVDSVA